MGSKFLGALALAGVAVTGAMSPASAQDYYGGGGRDYYQASPYSSGYADDDGGYRAYRARQYRRELERRREDYYRRQAGMYQDYSPQAYAEPSGYGYRHHRHDGYQCHSGTTGALVGAIAGGLLGREIGRGGAYDRPSTTGLILGAGAGALAGRAVGRSGNDCR